ncbi:MAG: CAP domain-containing protein [Planctomycetota bacterium]|jgi:hypothetical protein
MRRVIAVLLLASLAAAGGQVRLRAARWPFKVIRCGYRVPAEKPGVRKGKVNKLLCYFVDLDGNGTYDDVGVDGWALSGMNYVLPLEPNVVMELARVEWSVDEKGAHVEWKAEPIAIRADQKKVFRQFNYWRLINGLPPVDYDPELSKWCDEHCAWMEKNGFKHAAEEGDGAMSDGGSHAGRSSMLSQEAPGMSVLMMYASFYHRLPLFRPATRSIGIGCSAKYTAIDGMTRQQPREWIYPIIVPAPNSGMQPTHFPPESPRPYPASVKSPGCPITLTFDQGEVTEVHATLRVKKKLVPILVSSPEYPANRKRADNRMSICLIPREPLRPKTLYKVEVSYKWNGKEEAKSWVFTTGHRRPVWNATYR